MNLGLDRIEALLDELGHPETGLRGALVGGTNGKGSVIAMAGSVLRAAGHRVGTTPKPHLVSYRERIAVDGVAVSRERFAAAVTRALRAADGVAPELGPPTEFEVLTAVAVLELARSPIDVALVEVGLGGRLDATNALDLGVAAITTVGHDHERQLGPTLARIGAEKAAIIKPGDLAVTGATGRGLAPIRARSREGRVPLREAGPGRPYRATLRHAGWDGIVIDLRTPSGTMTAVEVGLLGEHQATNAATAMALLDALAEDATRNGRSLAVDEAALRAGLRAARWPGRLERMDGARLGMGPVLLDGAHNPAGAAALGRALSTLGVTGAPLVFGAMRDKRVGRMLRHLAGVPLRPVFTAVDDPHARTPGDLLRAWSASGGEAAATVDAALRRAAELAAPGQPVVVAGSLYLVGAVRGMLTGEREG